MTDEDPVASVSPWSRDPADPIDPAPAFARLREKEPVTGIRWQFQDQPLGTMWMVTRHADVCALLSSRHTRVSLDRGESAMTQPGWLPALDPPDHTRIRRMLTRELSAKRMAALRPRVEAIVAGLLNDLPAAGPPVDLVSAFALPVASQVICELLGVPYADRADFERRSAVFTDTTAGPEQQQQNSREMFGYMADLIARHRNDPGPGILGALIRDHDENLTDEELQGIGTILLIAGHETTAHTISLGTLLLIRHPDQLALVRDDPAVLDTAVEEILRFTSVASTGSPRLLTEDITVGGRTVSAGAMAVVSYPSANRDTDALPDADVFDVTRSPNPHLAFGHGIHLCVGQALARLELAVVFPALLKKLPNLRLVNPDAELQFRNSPINGLQELAVTWG
ncbi:cytochrome P450 [Actinoplanes sp. NPDC049548]|uniref:cytochrome P450 n=1 Tax=Actinoplanes sp. NPDC049548 TaxID=3155152 RepID=UPI0034335596